MKTDNSLPAKIKNIGRNLRARGKSGRRHVLRLILLGSCLMLFAAGCIAMQSLRSALLSQSAAERWRGESELRFAQVSCFLPADSGFDEGGVYAFREQADAALTAASITAEPDGQLLADAYSGRGSISISSSENSANVVALGIGGEFFLFHPLRLRFGSYLSANDINHDRVLLTEELAWKLFGAVDVAGMSVNIGAVPFQVAGVISREDDFFSRHANAAEIEAFLPFAALVAADENAAITCYELIMPDPVSGFALQTAEKYGAFAAAAMVENSARYSLAAALGIVGDFGLRAAKTDAIAYPYWENAARMVDDYLALITMLTLGFALPPLVVSVFFVARFLHRHYARLKRRIRDARTYE